MADNEAFAEAVNKLLGMEGVVGVSKEPGAIIVYVSNPSVPLPSSIYGIPIIKKVVGEVRRF